MAMLKVDNLNVYYGNIHAIKDLSFEVNEGEIISLIGANGAGKTTTLHTISGLLRSRTGSIEFMGKNISSTPAHELIKLGMAHVPEGRHVFLDMTVMENREMGAYSLSKVPKQSLDMVFESFPRLYERKNQVAGTLSGGEQQMLAMSRAIMTQPKLLMLDEPSMGLSPILVDQVFDIVKTFHSMGATILLVEQNAGKALEISDRAYVLESGRIVLSGTGQELATSPEIKKAYLGG